ncbi:MAG: alpha/beta fold hydrolase [Crocinitomicaceae bacterium]|nr:alpha/beta fold hydrolase [Crocinitomicaceae bacterium]
MKLLSLLFLLLSFQTFAQRTENLSTLKIEEIMAGNEFIGHQPDYLRWSLDGKSVLFEWNRYNQPGSSTYSYSLKNKSIDSVTPEFYETGNEFNGGKIHDVEIYSWQGNLYRHDRASKKTEIVLKSVSTIRNIQRNATGDCAFFQQGMGFYVYCIEERSIKQLVQFKKGKKDKESEPNYMEKEELELFEFLQDEKEAKEWRKEQNKSWSSKVPTIYFKGSSVNNIQIDGSGQFITYRINDNPTLTKTHVDHHIAADGHTYAEPARAKVHDEDPNHKLGIYDIKKDTSYFADFSTLPNIRTKPLYLKEYEDTTTEYSKDRNIIMHRMIYSEDGEKNVLDIRSYDNKDRWIVEVDLTNGKIRLVEREHNEAWIGGPGISNWNMVSGTLGWIDNEWFFYQSEKTGYSHLLKRSINTGNAVQLTKGKWEVHNAELSSKKDRFYITANKNHPGNREFYHLMIDSKELIPILTTDGNHEVSISPDEKTLAVRYSGKTSPWEFYIAENKKGASLERITNSTTEQFNNYDWYSPQVITFSASDGEKVHARIFQPEASKKNGAAVLFVHGAGYLQNAHNYWSGYYREFMFHNLLRDNGYTVLDVDYRASKGYGRDFRVATYRHMGGKDLSDHIDARQLLIDSLGIDPNRIGMYGGSYGGFMAIMALLQHPGKFKCGAAIRSVTDWFHYNHEYSSNILNYPSSDPEAYKKSSPIYFAENLEDRLLMLHGMVDNNVQFQDVVRLSQRFIELGKDNWETAVYPVEAHGFRKTSSWADEYRRIYTLFYQELLEPKN